MNRSVYTLKFDDVLLLAAVVVIFLGLVGHAVVASYSVESAVSRLVEPLSRDRGDSGAQDQTFQSRVYTIPLQLRAVRMPRDGVYNTSRGDFVSLMKSGFGYPLGRYPDVFGWYLPLPFLIPYIGHLLVVYSVPKIYALLRNSCEIRFAYGFGRRAIYSSIAGSVLLVYFQAARMFWGNNAWDGEFFVSVNYGWYAFYIFFAACVLMYVYLVFVFSGLRERRRITQKRSRCLCCGHNCEAGETCTECGLDSNLFLQPQFRLRVWWFAVLALSTFGIPLLVSSVYSVFN